MEEFYDKFPELSEAEVLDVVSGTKNQIGTLKRTFEEKEETSAKAERSLQKKIVDSEHRVASAKMEDDNLAIKHAEQNEEAAKSIADFTKETWAAVQAQQKEEKNASTGRVFVTAELAHHKAALAELRGDRTWDQAHIRLTTYALSDNTKIYSKVSLVDIRKHLGASSGFWVKTFNRVECDAKLQRMKHLGFKRHPHFLAIHKTKEFVQRFGLSDDVMTGHLSTPKVQALLNAYLGYDPDFPPQGQPDVNVDEDLFNDPEDQPKEAAFPDQENIDKGEYEYSDDDDDDDDGDDDDAFLNTDNFVDPEDQRKAASLKAKLRDLHMSAEKKPKMSSADTPSGKKRGAFNFSSSSTKRQRGMPLAPRAGGTGQDRPLPAAKQVPPNSKNA